MKYYLTTSLKLEITIRYHYHPEYTITPSRQAPLLYRYYKCDGMASKGLSMVTVVGMVSGEGESGSGVNILGNHK